MGKYRCPQCSTVVESESPANLVCPSCGYSSRARPAPPAAAPPPYEPQAPATGGYGVYGAPPQPPGGYAAGAPPQQKKTSGMAITSLVLGIISYCVGWIPYVGMVTFLTAILAIVFGALGIKQVNANPATVGGKGMAIAGLILGVVWFALLIILMIFFFALIGSIFGPGGVGRMIPPFILP